MQAQNKIVGMPVTAATPITVAAAERFAQQRYGIVGAATPLAGEKDDNFRITGPQGSYFLKIIHPDDDPGVIDLHTCLLTRLKSVTGVKVQTVLADRDGNLHPTYDLSDRPRMARMTTFLEGKPLVTVKSSVRLREELGRTIARIARELVDFQHDYADWPLIFDLGHGERIYPLLAEFNGSKKYNILAASYDRYCSIVSPALSKLRRQIVHNDLNLDNALIAADGTSVAGIIDFGDAVRTQLVNDVATAVMNQLVSDDDPLGPAIDLLRGYHQIMPLKAEEIALLYDLARFRAAVRVIVGEWRAIKFPANREYYLRNTESSWHGLHALTVAAQPYYTERFLKECKV